MQIRTWLMAIVEVLAVQVLAAARQQSTPIASVSAGGGTIEVRVTRSGTIEGISDVTVTLKGLASAAEEQMNQLFMSLTPAQLDQVKRQAENRVSPDASSEAELLNTVIPMMAQVLGQPAPQVELIERTLETGADGRVRFPDLPPGRYHIQAEREGYFALITRSITEWSTIASGDVTFKGNESAPVVLAFSMIRGVILSGRVRDPDGNPVAGVAVSAHQRTYQNGRAVLFPMSKQSPTDDRGVFRIFGLLPGEYYLSATPQGPAAEPGARDNWAKTYFPGVSEARMAAPVVAAEGAETGGLDFGLQITTLARIKGRIVNPFLDAGGNPTVPSSTLYLIPRDVAGLSGAEVLRFENLARERTSGEFEIAGVPPGSYDLLATAPNGAPGADPIRVNGPDGHVATVATGASLAATAWGRARVDVGNEDPDNVAVNLKPGSEVKIRVTVDGAAPPHRMAAPPQRGTDGAVVNTLVDKGATTAEAIAASRAAASANLPAQVPAPDVQVSLQSSEFNLLSATLAEPRFDPSGLYVFLNVPQGRYTVQANWFNGPSRRAYVADIRLGGVSVFDEGLLVDGALSGEVHVMILSNGARIEGTVENAEGQPVRNAWMVLVPAESRRGNPTLYKSTRSDAMGRFGFDGVPPGIYKSFGWESTLEGGVASRWRGDPEFLARYEQLGAPISVMGGESLSMTLKVIPKDAGR